MVREVRVYVEGGGPTSRTQSKLREGFDGFFRLLKQAASQHGVSLRFIVAGSRNEAFEDFRVALKTHGGSMNLLLVDAETEVTSAPRQHLQQRDSWDLSNVTEEQVHLMAQCMEAWLVADSEALSAYYGQGFKLNALPKRQNLEQEPKTAIYDALAAATRNTQKGLYGKISHACELLKRVDAAKAKARCPHCNRFFDTVSEFITSSTQN